MRRYQRAFPPTLPDPQPLAGNVVTNGSALDNASWALNVEATVSADVARAPDGAMTADKIVPSNVNSSNHIVSKGNLTTTGGDWIARGRFKSAGYDYVELLLGNTTGYTKFLGYTFDLARGQVCSIRNTTYTGPARIRRLANGWMFCEVKIIGADSNSTHRIDLHVLRTMAPTGTYTGDTVSGVLGWGIEFSAVPT